jgi:hypothetical protein
MITATENKHFEWENELINGINVSIIIYLLMVAGQAWYSD